MSSLPPPSLPAFAHGGAAAPAADAPELTELTEVTEGTQGMDGTGAAVDLDRVAHDLAGVELALERLDDGTYWTCEVTGRPLPDALLAADPIARRLPAASTAAAVTQPPPSP